MNKNTKLNLFKIVYKIRKVEETISKFYSENEMRCPVHLSIGQEAVASGVCTNLKENDEIISTHRLAIDLGFQGAQGAHGGPKGRLGPLSLP